MRKRLLVVAVAALLAATCGGDDTGETEGGGRETDPRGSQPRLVVQEYAFPALTVAGGAAIELVNRDDEAHTITADDRAFDSGSFSKGKPGSLTAPGAPGEYAYHCENHPTMRGTLKVE